MKRLETAGSPGLKGEGDPKNVWGSDGILLRILVQVTGGPVCSQDPQCKPQASKETMMGPRRFLTVTVQRLCLEEADSGEGLDEAG